MSDDDLPNGHEFRLGYRTLVSASLRNARRADTPGYGHEWRRQVERRGDAAQGEVGVSASDRVDDAGTDRRQTEHLSSFFHHDALVAVGDRQRVGLKEPGDAGDELAERQVALAQTELGFGPVQAVVVGSV